MNKLYEAAREELPRLEAELARNPVYQRILLCRQVVQVYGPQSSSAAQSHNTAEASLSSAAVAAHTPSLFTTDASSGTSVSTSAAVVAASRDYLQTTRVRATSGQLLRVATEKGIQVGGKKPSSTLASYLSNSDLFDNVPGQGYGLREWAVFDLTPQGQKDEAPNGKAAGASEPVTERH